MTLALVQVSRSDFETIHDHLTNHNPRHKNMHMRQPRIRNKIRGLRYLHAMRLVPDDQSAIEGMLSGPGVFAHYGLVATSTDVQLNVISLRGEPKELARFQKRFLHEVLVRVHQEQQQAAHFPKYAAGQYYLKRSKNGQAAGSPICATAAASGALAGQFVSVLRPWGFELIYR
jgi:hypothetical protein